MFRDSCGDTKRQRLGDNNIIKIICYRSWRRDVNTLKCIYNALIGSIFTYSFLLLPECQRLIWKEFRQFKNRAEIIFRLDRHETSDFPLIQDRLTNLDRRHIGTRRVDANLWSFWSLNKALQNSQTKKATR